jgi:hypothetical protein
MYNAYAKNGMSVVPSVSERMAIGGFQPLIPRTVGGRIFQKHSVGTLNRAKIPLNIS